MKGLVIFTAGREDAYQDYVHSVRDGVPIEEVEEYLSEEQRQTLTEDDNDETIRLWGTTVDHQWQKIEQGDIVLVYRDGEFIARARVVSIEENLPLAEHLWKYEENPWDDDNPWRFLVYVDQFEEINVSLEEFNALVGYEDNYIPQGFMRVADRRIRSILEDYDSLENAIADLTGTGERVHEIDDEEDEEAEDSLEQLKRELVAAGKDGNRGEEFERLVADAFNRLGCEARWIEGGSDTDVEITEPAHVVVEAKSRGQSYGVRNINAAGIVSHQNQRGADHGIVVGRHFPPQAIEDAERNEITTLTTDQLVSLLEKRAEYGIPPELIFDYLLEPGAFQEDRQDLLQDHIDERIDAVESMLAVLKGMDRYDEPLSAKELYFILVGMDEVADPPDEEAIKHTIQFLSHPSLQLLTYEEEGYVLTTDFENAVNVLTSVNSLIESTTEFSKD
ncbi:restriction endonuclease [Natrialba hulunbeirensis JCM 10989]|uniref:Restriction endonuclease n=1 Tax=Natrialba hulunbeirensis JCM 10989 TaxID=1227493 RepID=L9ZQ56_9EURY|nr:restriction endonuclease [Natrialba hulunbeirensis]ELY87692.1 restriction endonuclease [Natrialba hulunbeirensis JCM 10989]